MIGAERMSLGFSTMGCPGLSVPEVDALAQAFALGFVELRGLENTLDLAAYFRLRPQLCPATRVQIVATSLTLQKVGPEELAQCQELAALADRLGAPYLRVFGAGGPDMPEFLSRETLSRMAQNITEIRRTLAANNNTVKLILETHDVFSTSERCLALNELLEQPLDLLWDSHLTWHLGGEPLDETWKQLGNFIQHIHYKDSITDKAQPHGYRYTLPGAGEFPTALLRDLLTEAGYRKGLSLEWEKLWYPELAPLKEILPAFVRLFGEGSDPLKEPIT